MLTFYPRGFRSPPPGRIGFLDPGYERVKVDCTDTRDTAVGPTDVVPRSVMIWIDKGINVIVPTRPNLPPCDNMSVCCVFCRFVC